MAALENIEIGDYIAVSHYGMTPALKKVIRLTQTQIVCAHDERFNRLTGRRVGESGGFNTSYARKATEADYSEWRMKRAKRQLADIAVTAENLVAVEAFITAMKA